MSRIHWPSFWKGFREGWAMAGEAILMPWRIPAIYRKLWKEPRT